MKKLFVLAILVVLSVALFAVAGNVNSTDQKAAQSSIKAPTQPGDVPLQKAAEKPVKATEPAPVVTSQPKQNTDFIPVGGAKVESQESNGNVVIDNYDKSNDVEPNMEQQPQGETQPSHQPQGFDAQQGKWQPQYGPKGDLLNPEPTSGSILSSRVGEDLPHITVTQLFYENFSHGLWLGNDPPTGWTVLDSGFVWDNYDWFRYASSSWGVAMARIYGTVTTQKNNDWMISPSQDFSAASTVTLNFRLYYQDISTTPKDSGNVYLTDDEGATWHLVNAYTGANTGTLSAPFSASFDVSSFAAGKSDIKVAFQYTRDTLLTTGYFGFDNVEFVADGNQVFFETMDGTWGSLDGGKTWTPPAEGWTAIDNPDIWNNNDWHGYYYSSWTDTVANVYYSPVEWQNEWLITPAQDFSAHANVHLRFKSFYDDYTGDKDTAWVLGTTDNWATTQLVTMYVGVDSGSASSPAFPDYDITSWAGGQSNVKVAFKYVGNNALYCWYIDNVEFYEPDPLEVATSAILIPPVLTNIGNKTIASRVVNHGSQTVTFQDSTYITHEQLGSELFSEGFENGGAIPAGWTDIPGGPTQWLYDGGTDHGPGSAHGGSYAAYYNIYDYPSSAEDTLISPPLDLTGGGYVLNFWSWHSSGDDSVEVWLNEGGPMSYLMTMPNSATWMQNSVNLGSTYNGAKIYFIGYSRYGSYNIYIDDISVNLPSSIVVDYVGGATVTNLAPGASMDVTYPSTWNSPAEGTYNVTQFTNLAGDADPSNDTLTGTVTVYPHVGSGGPDAGYYSFIDNTEIGGPTFGWVDMSGATPITFSSTDAGYSWGVPLGGSFFYYGSYYDSVFCSTDGLVSFNRLSGGFTSNYGIPSSSGANNMVAFMWDDMLMTTNSSASYWDDVANNRLVVEYDNIQFYSSSPSSDTLDAQIIFDRTDWSITVQYANFGTELQYDATVGIENAAGDIGLQYFFNTDLGNYPYDGLAIKYTYAAPARDVAVNNILAPPSFVVNGATFTPSVVMSNVGSITENFNAYFKIFDSTPSEVYTSTVPVSLISGQIDTVDFASTSLSVNGAYSCSTYVDAGDPTPANDWLRSTFTVDQHYGEGGPDDYLYKWIDNTVVGGPTYSWIELNPDSGGTGTMVGGTVNADDAAYKVLFGGFSFPFYGTNFDSCWANSNGLMTFGSSSTSYSNTYIPNTSTPNNYVATLWDDWYYNYTNGSRIFAQNFGTYMVIEWFALSKYSTGVASLTFEVILNADGSMIVQYMNIGGGTYYDGSSATIGMENGAGTTGLQYVYNNVPPLNLPTIGLAIKYYLYTPALDVAMMSYDSPQGGFVGTPYYPAGTVKNNGSTPTTADVTIQIQGPAPDTTTVFYATETTPSMAQDEVLPFTFTTNSWTPAAGGFYAATAMATTSGDEIPGNGTATGNAVILSTAALDFSTDFEANNGGFVGNNQWQWGTPAYASGPPVDSIPSGVNLWGTNLTGDYSTYAYNSLYSPAFTLTGSVSYIAEFEMWHRLEGSNAPYYYDGANLKISTDFGATWEILTTSVPYAGACYGSTDPLYGQPVWSGYRNWTPVSVSLGAYAGQTVILRFDQGSDNSINYAGLYIDDFSVRGISIDVAVNSIDEPGFILLPGSYTITATLENLGAAQVTLDSIGFEVYDETPALVYSSALYSQPIDPGTAQFSSPTQWSPTLGMDYTVAVTAYIDGDGVPSNNSASALSEVQIPRAFPHVEDLETLDNWWIFYDGPGAGVYWSTSRYHSPTHSLYFSYSPYPRDAWLVGPPVEITAATAPLLQFWEDQQYWGDDPDETHGVALITDTFDFNNLTELVVWDTSHVINGFAGDPQEFDISAYIGHIVWPVFEFHAVNNGGNWYLDDIGMIESAIPEIGVDPASLSHVQETDINRTFTGDFTISNTGTGDLNFTINNTLTWITPGMASGSVPSGNSQPIDLTVNTTGIAVGTYNDNLVIDSNDPATPEVMLPVQVVVSQVAPDVDHFSIVVNAGEISVTDFNIGNGSSADVHVELSAAPPEWLSVDPTSADIPAGGNIVAHVTVDASALAPGTYNGTVTIQSSNLILSLIELPVDVTVQEGPVCDYVVGDANGSGTFNGLDVTYSVAYFKGGPLPPYSCECTPGHTWYVAGDVNGSCSFNGLDVTYMVAYFKGGPSPSPCPDCPPARLGILKAKSQGASSGQ